MPRRGIGFLARFSAGDDDEPYDAGLVVIDHDCPLCAMQAELPGPMFWHLDGCNMDDDFAFSFHSTHEEWEQERREWDDPHFPPDDVVPY